MRILASAVVCSVAGLIALSPFDSFAGIIFAGDGSDEPGFVAPPPRPPDPPPPPANMSGGESYVPYPGPPVTPQSRSEKKAPPKPPVMFTKLTSQYGEIDWAARPNDLNNLLKSLKGMADVDFACEAKSFAEVNADPEQNPILYRSGHFHFSLSPAEQAKLREYLLAGGMIIFNAGMGSKPFYDSARKVMEQVLPEAPVRRLSPDHPVFHSYYDVDKVEYRQGVRNAGYASNEPWLEGVTVNCRTVAIISRWGMEVGWDPVEDESLLAYEPADAQKLGMNILAYATSMRAWARQAAQAMTFTDAQNVSVGGSMAIAQVVYGGEWKTRHAGISVLLQQFNRKTEIPVKFERKELSLTDPKLRDAPVLYMTGHEDFQLKPEELNALRTYLANGGLLIGEACCGRKGFDNAFREMLAKVLPGAKLQQFMPGHPLFNMPNKITKLTVTPATTGKDGGKGAIDPVLLGVEQDGHLAVIYSPYGMAGGWELSQSPYAIGYDDSSALLLGENILMYAITQ